MFVSEEFLNREWNVLQTHILYLIPQIKSTIINVRLNENIMIPIELQNGRSIDMTNLKHIPFEVVRLKSEFQRII